MCLLLFVTFIMNWLKNFVTPKIKAFMGAIQSSENLWTKCPACEKMLYTKELAENLFICNHCAHHFKIPSKLLCDFLFDNETYENIPLVGVTDDPLKFRDSKKYTERLKDARQKTSKTDAASIASGKIGGKPAVLFIMDFAFMGGSMGLAVGKSFAKAIDLAIKNNAAFLSFTASGGARMQEGMFSLMQMPATIASLCFLKEKKLPFINVFTNPTTGGVLASFATLGDIHIAEPNALIGFAGARVIKQTIKQDLPQGFQRSEFLKSHGMIDIISNRKDLKQTIAKLLQYTL